MEMNINITEILVLYFSVLVIGLLVGSFIYGRRKAKLLQESNQSDKLNKLVSLEEKSFIWIFCIVLWPVTLVIAIVVLFPVSIFKKLGEWSINRKGR